MKNYSLKSESFFSRFRLFQFNSLLLAPAFFLWLGVFQSARGAAPVNDSFGSAIVLTGNPAQSQSSNVGASTETGEPASGSATVWWTWTAPDNGILLLDTLGSVSFMKYLTISLGDSVDHQYVIRQTRAADPTASIIVTKGLVYRIAIGGEPSFGTYTGALTVNALFSANNAINHSFIPLPVHVSNQKFGNRTLLTSHREVSDGFETTAIGYNWGAQPESFAPGIAGVHPLWWEWVCPTTGVVTIDALGSSSFYKNLVIYQGTNIAELSVYAASTRTPDPRCVFPATAGTHFIISLGNTPNFGDNFGDLVLNFFVKQQPIPSNLFINTDATSLNDYYFGRVQLKGGGNTNGFGVISAIGSNVGAGRESNEPGNTGASTLWWVWTAPASGPAQIDMEGSDAFLKEVNVYMGGGIGSLTQIASATRLAFPVVSFDAVAGVQYSICIGNSPNYGDNTGNIIFTIRGPEIPNIIEEPEFRMRLAVELEVPTSVGSTYQVQMSSDLAGWQDFQTPIQGDGTSAYILKSTRTDPFKFFRLRESNSSSGLLRFIYPK
jgi:hypothetical protein